jgi:hypothetical protein
VTAEPAPRDHVQTAIEPEGGAVFRTAWSVGGRRVWDAGRDRGLRRMSVARP